MMYLSSGAEMNPLPSLSNTLNASLMSSSESMLFTFCDISVRNSPKSIVPLSVEAVIVTCKTVTCDMSRNQ